MTRLAIAAAACALALAGTAAATTPPPNPKPPRDTKMGNVYYLAHAGAILDICLASPGAEEFPEEKSREIADLAGRLTELVRTIGQHYRDGDVPAVYQATKARLASDTKLRFHVKNNHQYCGERTLGEMRAYVTENEGNFKRFFERKRLEAQAKPAAPK
jgi:hypothetical protein